MGRRTKYDNTFPARAQKLAQDGLMEDEIAKQLGVSVATFATYKNLYPEFLYALKQGKAPIDDAVESALLRSATGYDLDYVEEELDASGKVVKTKRGSTHVKPNPTSMIFFLKNRRPDKWRDKQEIEHSGEIKIEIDKDDEEV